MKQTYSLQIEFKENEDNETYEIAGELTFLEIKRVISLDMCGGSEHMKLWWMGEEVLDTMSFKEMFGDRDQGTVTLYCERKVQTLGLNG